MKIVHGEVREVPIALAEPYEVAYGSVESASSVFLRLETDSGLIGFGAANADEEVTGETASGMRTAVAAAVEAGLRGADPLCRERIWQELNPVLEGQPSARAAVDMALFDLLGKAAGLPVWKLLGGFRDRIETDVTIGIDSLDQTVREAQRWVARGFSQLKLKIGRDVDEDLRRLHAVRHAVGPEVELRIDANQGYSVEQAIGIARDAQPMAPSLLEQPTPKNRIDQLAEVRHAVSLPIMADECVLNARDAFEVARRHAADLVSIKLMKSGGVDEAMRIAAVARATGIKAMISCMDESRLGIAAALHFACACPTVELADLDGHLALRGDPSRGGFVMDGGWLHVLDVPGWGVEVAEP